MSTDARDGQHRVSLEITADSVVSLDRPTDAEGGSFGGTASGSGGETVRPGRQAAPARPSDDDLDDLPF